MHVFVMCFSAKVYELYYVKKVRLELYSQQRQISVIIDLNYTNDRQFFLKLREGPSS